MNRNDWSPEIAALTPYVRGKVLELRGPAAVALQGTMAISRGTHGNYDLGGVGDGSIDALVTVGPSDLGSDPCADITEWRRVVREGGTLAFVLTTTAVPNGLLALLHRVGGFAVDTLRAVRPGSWLLVATRRQLAEVQKPLGAIGPELAAVAAGGGPARAELYFQIGTILLQAGDPALAEQCFASMLRLEPNSAEGAFGLGMCLCCQDRMDAAAVQLRRALELDPDNAEARRWLALAERKQTAPQAPVADPALYPVAPPAKPAAPPRVAGPLRIATYSS